MIDLTKDKDEDLEKAIALSLQEAQVFSEIIVITLPYVIESLYIKYYLKLLN